MRATGLALLLALATASARAPAGPEDARVAWEAARVGVPAGVAGELAIFGTGNERPVRLALRARPERPRRTPAVIVLHGCAGISGEEETLLYLLTLNGFAVFVPDSFARAGRAAQCDVVNATAVIDPRVYARRHEELAHTRRRVAEIAWVDQQRVFLVGISEGGATAAVHDADGFAGVVIVGWHCAGRSAISGLRVPAETPVLAMLMDEDPWYAQHRGRHCGEHFDDRPRSRSLVLPGTGHSVLHASDVATGDRVKREVLQFLRAVGAHEVTGGGPG